MRDGTDVQNAFMTILAADSTAQSLFPTYMTMQSIVPEDPGSVTVQQDKICTATLVAETDADGSGGTGVQTGVAGRLITSGGGLINRTYLLGIIVYVSDRTRSTAKKQELVRLTGQIKNVLLKYRSDPDPSRQLGGNSIWYHTLFMPGRTTTYRKTEAHQQSITLLNIYTQERIH